MLIYKATMDSYKDWNNIDLHSHTREGYDRKGKKDNVAFSYSIFINVILSPSLRLMACTNHNFIHFGQYIVLRYLARMVNCNYLMGVELDSELESNHEPLHIALISKSDNLIKDYCLAQSINAITERERESIRNHTKEDIVFAPFRILEFFRIQRIILIPHGDKDKGLFNNAGPEKIAEALQLVRENFIHVMDSKVSKWKLEKLKTNLMEDGKKHLDDFGGVLFSDVHDWLKYDESYRPFAMNAEPTFNGFLHSISNPTKRFDLLKDVVNPTNYISYAVIEDGKGGATKLDFSPSYNCIIGKSGSGKSLFLSLLGQALGAKDAPSYYGAYSGYVIRLYNNNGDQIDGDRIKPLKGAAIYNEIIKALSSAGPSDMGALIGRLRDEDVRFVPHALYNSEIYSFKERLGQYVNLSASFKDAAKTLRDDIAAMHNEVEFLAKHSGVKVLSVIGEQKTVHAMPDVPFDSANKEIQSIAELLDLYKGKYKEVLAAAIERLSEIVKLSKLDYEKQITQTKLLTAQNHLINRSIGNVNNDIGQLAKRISESQSSLSSLIPKIASSLRECYLLAQKADSISLALHVDKFLVSETTIANGIVVREEPDDYSAIERYEVSGQNGFFKIRGHTGSLKKMKVNLTKTNEVRKMVDTLIDVGVIENASFSFDDSYVSFKTTIFFDGEDVSKLNPGNIAKRYIVNYFANKVQRAVNSVVYFDQIENDVDKEFLSEVVVPEIEKTHKLTQLFIVTHDPIIAVNADPRRYILASKEQDGSIGYRSFSAESEERDELDTIAKCVDGSKDVIKHRYEIYEREV